MDQSIIEKNRKQCHKILKAMDVLEQIYKYEPQNEIEEIFKLYITEEGATNAAKYLNNQGKRVGTTRGVRKYSSIDIMNVLKSTESTKYVNRLIFSLTHNMLNRNRRNQKWHLKLIDLCSFIE